MAGPKFTNCRVCGKLFAATGKDKICPECKEKEADLEQKAIDYVRDHPKSSVKTISDETGVSEKIVMRLIDEGRFEEVGVTISYPCANCGKPIATGKYCSDCMEKLRSDLQATSKQILKAASAVKKNPNSGSGAHSSSMKH